MSLVTLTYLQSASHLVGKFIGSLSIQLVFKVILQVQNGVTYAKLCNTKLRQFNYNFCCLRNKLLNQLVRNHLISTSEKTCLTDPCCSLKERNFGRASLLFDTLWYLLRYLLIPYDTCSLRSIKFSILYSSIELFFYLLYWMWLIQVNICLNKLLNF